MWKDQKGLTYIETLIAVPVTLLFLAILMTVVIAQYKNWLLQQEVVKLQRELQVAIQAIYKDLAMAGYSIGEGESIVLADRRLITFQSNRNADNSVETITYQRSSESIPLAQLLRSNRPLADRITFLEFRYYDENNIELAGTPLTASDRKKIRLVKVTLKGRVDSSAGESQRGQEIALTSKVRLRNIGA